MPLEVTLWPLLSLLSGQLDTGKLKTIRWVGEFKGGNDLQPDPGCVKDVDSFLHALTMPGDKEHFP